MRHGDVNNDNLQIWNEQTNVNVPATIKAAYQFGRKMILHNLIRWTGTNNAQVLWRTETIFRSVHIIIC